MPFWVYVLRCSDDSYYTGHTDDLDRRLAQHRAGTFPGYTQSRLPVELMYTSDFPTREEALAMERRIKGWTRAKKEALFRGDWQRLRELSASRDSPRSP